jgi:hypothetical protein
MLKLPITILKLPITILKLPIMILKLPITIIKLPITIIKLPITIIKLPIKRRDLYVAMAILMDRRLVPKNGRLILMNDLLQERDRGGLSCV